jgi:hypothetical protein
MYSYLTAANLIQIVWHIFQNGIFSATLRVSASFITYGFAVFDKYLMIF